MARAFRVHETAEQLGHEIRLVHLAEDGFIIVRIWHESGDIVQAGFVAGIHEGDLRATVGLLKGSRFLGFRDHGKANILNNDRLDSLGQIFGLNRDNRGLAILGHGRLLGLGGRQLGIG